MFARKLHFTTALAVLLGTMLSAIPSLVCAKHNTNMPTEERKVYLKLIGGYSFARKADIEVNNSIWDPALEGYNQKLKSAPILGAGIGYQPLEYLTADITATHRWRYRYRKFQTTPANPGTPQPLPSKTRKFDLDSTSVMIDLRLLGRGFQNLYYTVDSHDSYIAPILGGGIGVTYHTVRNFYSEFAPTPLTTPLNATSSIGQTAATKAAFTYQLEAGLEYRYRETWGLMAGYRWFDAGKFKTPTDIIGGTGLAGNPIAGSAVPPWTGKLRANEFFVELTYHF